MKECPKCKKLHEKIGTYCSKSCALSCRIWKDSTKEKIRQDNLANPRNFDKKKPLNICLICGKATSNLRFCSPQCSGKGRKVHSNESYERQAKTLSKKISNGEVPRPPINFANSCKIFYLKCVSCGKTFIYLHSKKKSCSQSCRNKLCGGYKPEAEKNRHRGAYVKDSQGKEVYLASSYEVLLASILNLLKFQWLKPKGFLTGRTKTELYYPDFYLPDYNLYLDPKNDYLIKLGLEKIEAAETFSNIKVLVLRFEDLTESKVLKLVGESYEI